MIRKVIAYKDYFVRFYKSQDSKTQEKIEYVIDLLRFENKVPKKFFKYLQGTDGIYEIRVITTYKSIRILSFFDKGDLVVLVNTFVKKRQKTPMKEIALAEQLKKSYINEKYGGEQNEKHR